jgi:hypothetical protein
VDVPRQHGAMVDLYNVTIHSPDPVRLGRFWSAALDYTIDQQDPSLVRLRGPRSRGAPDLLLLHADVVVPGAIHLDLSADDIDAEATRLIALGAKAVDPTIDNRLLRRSANGIDWVVLSDPDGNPFCIGAKP